MRSRSPRLMALLLPSKGRWLDLAVTLALVPLKAPPGFRAHFYVCANYPAWQLALLRVLFGGRATFIDERSLEWKGMTGAYNYAFDRAVAEGAEWVALWADDLLPEKRSWLRELAGHLGHGAVRFGIFSSDEGHHKGAFGWNVFAGYPCAHFFIARVDSLPGYMLNPKLRAYVSDNEMAVSRMKAGVPIDLLPVRVIHQPTMNPTRVQNSPSYAGDLQRFYEIHPDLKGRLDGVVLRGDVRDGNSAFIPDRGTRVRFGPDAELLGVDEFSGAAYRPSLTRTHDEAGRLRRLWNEEIPSAGQRVLERMGNLL